MTTGAPSAQEVLAEWTEADPAADLAKWQEGLRRYESGLSGAAELDDAAELMCAGLASYIAGRSVITGWGNESAHTAVARTTWNVLAATLDERFAGQLTAMAGRRLRLALVAVRACGYQPQDLGGGGFMAGFFDARGRHLMALALSASPARAGQAMISLESWFTPGNPGMRPGGVPGSAALEPLANTPLSQQSGLSRPTRWEAAKRRARQTQQHVNPLALQHSVEAVQDALTGANLARPDEETGKLKVNPLGVAKAVFSPQQTALQAVQSVSLTSRVKAYNDDRRSISTTASPEEFASYPSKSDFLRDWARQLIAGAGITPTAPLITEYAGHAANGIIEEVFRPLGITRSAEPGWTGPAAPEPPRALRDEFDRMYQAATQAGIAPQLVNEQAVAFLNNHRKEWTQSIRARGTG
jgi:hypothetical protein